MPPAPGLASGVGAGRLRVGRQTGRAPTPMAAVAATGFLALLAPPRRPKRPKRPNCAQGPAFADGWAGVNDYLR